MLKFEESVEGFLDDLKVRLQPRLGEIYLQEILGETEAHLRQSIEEMVALGIPTDEAERAAVFAFGCPRFATSTTRAAMLALTITIISATSATMYALTTLHGFGSWSTSPISLTAAVLGVPLGAFFFVGTAGAKPLFRTTMVAALFGAIALATILPFRYIVREPGWDFQRVLPTVQSPSSARYELDNLRSIGDSSTLAAATARLEGYQTQFNEYREGRTPAFAPPETFNPWSWPLETMTPVQSRAAWLERGKSRLQELRDYRAFLENRIETLQVRLDEPYRSRLITMSPWSAVLSTAWFFASAAAQVLGFALSPLSRRQRRTYA